MSYVINLNLPGFKQGDKTGEDTKVVDTEARTPEEKKQQLIILGGVIVFLLVAITLLSRKKK